MCRAKALLAFIFPVPVFLKRFAAPLLVFNFGTPSSFLKKLFLSWRNHPPPSKGEEKI
jgi:hypothetical protein